MNRTERETRLNWTLVEALLRLGALLGACEEYLPAELFYVANVVEEMSVQRGLSRRAATELAGKLRVALRRYQRCTRARPWERTTKD